MEAPASDRTLGADEVARVTGEQFPELRGGPVRYLGSGFEHDVWLVGEAVVFRFPRYAAVADGLEYDRRVHELARIHVGGAVGIPEVAFHGRPDSTFPHRFVGHALVEGVGLGDRAARLTAPAGLGADLGRALAAVHSVPLDEAAGALHRGDRRFIRPHGGRPRRRRGTGLTTTLDRAATTIQYIHC